MKLAIGIPNVGTIKTKTVYSLFKFLQDNKADLIFQEGCTIHRNREIIVEKALELECTHLLFIDSDMYFEPLAIKKLIDRKRDIIGALCMSRSLDSKPNIRGEIKDEPCFEVEGIGTGFLLIKLDVFKQLKRPWFFYELDEKGVTMMSEDYYFCKKAREAVFKVWCDKTLGVKHLGEYAY